MNDDLVARVRRIYAAAEAAEEMNVAKVPATVIHTPSMRGVMQDFRGGMSTEEISNTAHTLIHNIANLRDHLRRWAAKNGKDKERVDAVFAASLDLRLIQDLSNNDKHGPPRDGGHSNVAPSLREVDRVMRLEAAPGTGVALFLTAGGKSSVRGRGVASVVITGQVVDRQGNVIGDLFEIERKAIHAWESLLIEFGIIVSAE